MKHGMKPKKKMYGGSMMKKKKKKKMNVGGKMKPDYIDLDKDGNKTESMKKAAADKKSGVKMKKDSPASQSLQRHLKLGAKLVLSETISLLEKILISKMAQ